MGKYKHDLCLKNKHVLIFRIGQHFETNQMLRQYVSSNFRLKLNISSHIIATIYGISLQHKFEDLKFSNADPISLNNI